MSYDPKIDTIIRIPDIYIVLKNYADLCTIIGEKEKFDLLSVSIGIVSKEVSKIDAYAQPASIATEVKKLAEMQKGPAIIKDRRISAHERVV